MTRILSSQKKKAILKVFALTLLFSAGCLLTPSADQPLRAALGLLVAIGAGGCLTIAIFWRKPVQSAHPVQGETWRGSWRKYLTLSSLGGVEGALRLTASMLPATALGVQHGLVVLSITVGLIAILLWIFWNPEI